MIAPECEMKLPANIGLMRRVGVAAVAVTGAVAVAACAYNESLGRNQFVLMDDSALMQSSQAAWAETLRTQKVSSDRALNNRVKSVGDKLVSAAGLGNRSWTYAVFEQDAPNAFVLPSGHIGVTTSLLGLARNDDQLAAVIGHEIGHVVARHAAERTSTSTATSVLLGAVQSRAGDYSQAVQAYGGLGAQLGVLLPFSRRHELEADRLGVDYMVRAGYRANESIALWQTMAAQRQGSTPEFASTHPSDQTRIAELQAYISQRGYN